MTVSLLVHAHFVCTYLSPTCNTQDSLRVSVEGGGKDDIH